MGSISRIIPPNALRPYLIDAVERGIRRAVERTGASDDRNLVADPLARRRPRRGRLAERERGGARRAAVAGAKGRLASWPLDGEGGLWAWGGLERAEVVAAASGAPRRTGGEPAPAAISLSHRNGRALAVVADPGLALGCDLEATEARSGASRGGPG